MWTRKTAPAEGHPIDRLQKEIDKRGLVVIDNVTSMPAYNEPYVSSNFVISVCHRGWVHAEYDDRDVEFRPKEISVVYPNHMIRTFESSTDYLATLLVVSPNAVEDMRLFSSNRAHFIYQRHPAFPLTDSQYDAVQEIFSLARAVCGYDSVHRTHMLANLLDTLFMMLDFYRFPDGNDVNEVQKSHGEQLFTRYYDLIVKHHAETREVGFYAAKFNLTPKYFSTLIKRETGFAAGEWISNHIVILAKSMLRNRPDLNIQQIGSILGFTDQAAFSRYIKVNAGVTPREYRNR